MRMDGVKMTLIVQRQSMAVCRLDPAEPIPDWSCRGKFFSLTRTTQELSIVCEEQYVPAMVTSERDWRMLKIDGILDFGLVGIVAGVSTVLAAARLGIFVLSTYDTDYILVKQAGLAKAVEALRLSGYQVVEAPLSRA